jgi:hypothetical protein
MTPAGRRQRITHPDRAAWFRKLAKKPTRSRIRRVLRVERNEVNVYEEVPHGCFVAAMRWQTLNPIAKLPAPRAGSCRFRGGVRVVRLIATPNGGFYETPLTSAVLRANLVGVDEIVEIVGGRREPDVWLDGPVVRRVDDAEGSLYRSSHSRRGR